VGRDRQGTSVRTAAHRENHLRAATRAPPLAGQRSHPQSGRFPMPYMCIRLWRSHKPVIIRLGASPASPPRRGFRWSSVTKCAAFGNVAVRLICDSRSGLKFPGVLAQMVDRRRSVGALVPLCRRSGCRDRWGCDERGRRFGARPRIASVVAVAARVALDVLVAGAAGTALPAHLAPRPSPGAGFNAPRLHTDWCARS